jgi:hypothetical protein
MYVTAATPPTPVMAAGVPGTVLLIDNVLVTLVPLQPVTTTVIVPVVNVVAYLILTLLLLETELIPIVDGLETDHAYDTASVAVIEYKALSPAPMLPHTFILPETAEPTAKLHVAKTVIVVVPLLVQPVVGLV